MFNRPSIRGSGMPDPPPKSPAPAFQPPPPIWRASKVAGHGIAWKATARRDEIVQVGSI